MKKFYYFLITILCISISSIFYVSTLDEKVQDVFLSTRPSLKQSNEFVLISLDDKAIKNVGFFPFNRDLYGDLLLLLKESNANTVVFDLSFYDDSRNIENDEYFANCINVFENVFIGQTFANQTDFEDSEDFEERNFYSEKSQLPFVKYISESDKVTPEFDLTLPPVKIIEDNSKGSGFVNASDDKDGYMRRIHLVSKFDNKYHGQLMFRALLSYLNNPEIILSDSNIVLKNVYVDGILKDIKIPRSKDGSFILKYPKMEFDKLNNISASYLIDIMDMEKELDEEIEFFNELDFFKAVPEEDNPYLMLQQLNNMKENIIYPEDSKDDITFIDYLVYKNKYYDLIRKYLSGNYIDWVFELYTSQEDQQNINTNFEILSSIFENLLIEKNELKSIVNNTICTFGTAASSTGDYTNTFYENHAPCFAIHQVIANQIYNQDFTDDCSWCISFIIAIVLSISCTVAVILIKSFKKKLVSGISFIFFTIFVFYVIFLISDIYVGLVVPLISVSLTFISLTIIEYINTHKEKAYIINAFGHFLSKDVVNEIVKDSSKLVLGGEDRIMTAVFTDIRGFTTICDKLGTPQKVVNLLNKYLSKMSDIILSYNGTIDKFEGDAIICFFGAPISLENHEELACHAALEMKKAENFLNEQLLLSNETPIPLFTRIGINSGEMTVGNMGTSTMMNYTMMGPNVNLASRLEGLNKRYNTRGIIISENTRNKIGNKFIVRSLEKVLVVGSENPVKIYELLSENNNPKLENYIEDWEKAIKIFEAKDYESALKEFTSLEKFSKNDGVLNYFIKQCNTLINNPPASDWDGVFKITVK